MKALSGALLIITISSFSVLSGGCLSGDKYSDTRPVAPERYEVASRKPSIRNFPEFLPWKKSSAPISGISSETSPNPVLPPLPRHGIDASNNSGLRPVSLEKGAGNEKKLLKIDPNRSKGKMHAMEQLIYGGEFAKHDEEGEYKFNVRDRLKIAVKRHPEFEGTVTVQQDGTVRIPNTDDYVTAKGMTVNQLKRLVEQKLAPYTKRPPYVKITIQFARGEYYFLFGDAQNKGRFAMGVTPIRLSEAVFRANSTRFIATLEEDREERLREEVEISPRENFKLPTYCDLAHVSVITPHRTRPTRRIYNVKEALFQGKTGNDPIIKPGQIVFVPSTFDKRIINFFERFIEPIQIIGQADAEAGHWYGRITGNKVKGIKPKVYEVEDEE